MSDVQVTAFLARRARALLRLTQGDMAVHCGVAQATISRWERGLQKPSAEMTAELKMICRYRLPPLSEQFVLASPVPKLLTALDDFSAHIHYSAGLQRMISKVGGTVEAWGETETRAARILNANVAADPRWLAGEIAFFETLGTNAYPPSMVPAPVHLVCAPVHEIGMALFEGVFLDNPPDPEYIKLHMTEGGEELIFF